VEKSESIIRRVLCEKGKPIGTKGIKKVMWVRLLAATYSRSPVIGRAKAIKFRSKQWGGKKAEN